MKLLPIGTIVKMKDNLCPYRCRITGYATVESYEGNSMETHYVMHILGPHSGYYVETMKMAVNSFLCHPDSELEIIDHIPMDMKIDYHRNRLETSHD